jgi:hypothetical protein
MVRRRRAMLGPICFAASLLLLFIDFGLCAHSPDAGTHHSGASGIPRIAFPSPDASLNNIDIQVSVTGHHSWEGSALMLVLDHGVQGVVVPLSGLVHLGIVAAGRSATFCMNRPNAWCRSFNFVQALLVFAAQLIVTHTLEQ